MNSSGQGPGIVALTQPRTWAACVLQGNEEFNYFIHAQKHLDEFWRKRHLVHDLYANSPPSAL